MATHAYITFKGVQAHLEVQATLTHGIVPSQFQIQVPPTPGIDEGGTLALIYGGTRIQFPNCKVDRIDLNRSGEGLTVWSITVLDRRWKWKDCGQVSGYYNVREGENTSAEAGIPKQIRKGTEKHLRDLMKLCLDAMGEKGYDVSKVPNDLFPEVEWDYEVPAVALSKLAELAKMRIVLTLRDRVELWPEGAGNKLSNQQTLDYQITVDPPERPDKLIFVGSRQLFEADIPLQAVCRATTEEWVDINHPSITWKPEKPVDDGNHWARFDIGFGNSVFETPVTTINGVKTLRDLAKADIYRKYRPGPFPMTIEGAGLINSIDQILPLLSTRLVSEQLASGKPAQAKSPAVWGVYSRDDIAAEVFPIIENERERLDLKGNPPRDLMIDDGWQLDPRTGIVSFNRLRFRYATHPVEEDGLSINGRHMMPAQLWLRVAFGLRDEKTRAWKHYEITRNTPGRKFSTQAKYVKADDAFYRTIITKDGVKPGALLEYQKIAQHYLDLEEKKYESRDPCAATYAGWLPVQPDGAIWQVTWALTDRGATTHVSRNREEPALALTNEEQNMYRQIFDKLKTDPTTSRAADDKTKRRPV